MKVLRILMVLLAVLTVAGCAERVEEKEKTEAIPELKVADLKRTAERSELKPEGDPEKPSPGQAAPGYKADRQQVAVDYQAKPLKISEIEAARLAQTRAPGSGGFAWGFRHAEYPWTDNAAQYGWVLDGQNKWCNQNTFSDAPVALRIYANSLPVEVQDGDYVTLTYDGGKSIKIYPPAFSSVNTEFYIDINGSTYTDRELSNLAKAAPTPG